MKISILTFGITCLISCLLFQACNASTIAGVLDFGSDDGWVPTNGSPVQGTNLVVGSGLTYTHTATGSTMTITSARDVSAGNMWRDTQIDFSTTQVRTDWNLPNNSSIGSDLQYIKVEVDFGPGVGESAVGAADGGALPFDSLDNINWSSQNGSSEAYEWGILLLEGLAGGSVNEAALATYTQEDYNNGITIGAHVGESATGLYSADGLNTTITPGDPDPAAGIADETAPLTQTEFGMIAAANSITGLTWYAGVVDVTDAVDDSGFSETNSSPSAGLSGIEWNASATQAVPEPSSLAVGLLALVGVLTRRQRN